MWVCPKCGSTVDDAFEVCWSCGTTPEGVEDPTFLTADETGPIADAPPRIKRGEPFEPELPEPAAEIVEAYRARDAAEAKFVVDQLAGQEIPAMTQGTRMSAMEYPVSLFSPRVMVREADFARARTWCLDYDRRKQQRAAAGE
jgi:hypothetical protein